MRQFQRRIKQVVLEWRRQLTVLDPNQKPSGKSPVFNFHVPCQVDIIRLFHPYHKFDYKLCLISHFEDAPDLAVRVIGQFYPMQIPAALDDYINATKWQRPLPEQEVQEGLWAHSGATTYSQALANAIMNAYSSVQTYLNNSNWGSQGIVSQNYGMGALPGGCFFWGVAGPIEKVIQDPAKFVATEIAKELEFESKRKELSIEQPGPRPRRSLGAFLLPPEWIGEIPKLSTREYLEGVRPELVAHQNVVLKTSYKRLCLIVTQSGCLIFATEDNSKATKLMNELFAVALFSELPALSVRPTDFVSIYDFDKPFTSYGYEDKLNAEQRQRLEGERPWSTHVRPSTAIPVERIAQIIRKAEDLAADPRRSLALQFCLEAWSFLHRREYRSAFLAAWTAIERDCYELWEQQLKQGQTNQAHKGRLMRWDISRVVDILHLSGLMDAAQLAELDKTRTLRNNVLHQGEEVGKPDAQSSVELAMKLSAKAWRLTVPKNLPVLLHGSENTDT